MPEHIFNEEGFKCKPTLDDAGDPFCLSIWHNEEYVGQFVWDGKMYAPDSELDSWLESQFRTFALGLAERQ